MRIKVTQIIDDYGYVGTEYKKAKINIEYEFGGTSEALRFIETITLHGKKPCTFAIEKVE